MSANRVWLIGHVAAPPRSSDAGVLLLVATVRGHWTGTFVDRHLVRTAAGQAIGLATGALALVEGRLSFEEGWRRDVVVAEKVTVLIEPEPPALRPTSGGIHASPVPHDRAGHLRRVSAGSAGERLVWVRPTFVGEPR